VYVYVWREEKRDEKQGAVFAVLPKTIKIYIYIYLHIYIERERERERGTRRGRDEGRKKHLPQKQQTRVKGTMTPMESQSQRTRDKRRN